MSVDATSALAIAFGAALGALSRWLLTIALAPMSGHIPLGTLAANLIGGLLMGIVIAVLPSFPNLPVPVQLALTTGFLGGLTTFSAFSGETVGLMLRGHWLWSAAIVVVHVAGSLFATLLGVALVRVVART
ncbi:MAG: fluoride efflux transporter CrcB [Xanthomonadales bacterium]|nr:fluoride efflux transporter CrcB [Xanthomonadales bacterium]